MSENRRIDARAYWRTSRDLLEWMRHLYQEEDLDDLMAFYRIMAMQETEEERNHGIVLNKLNKASITIFFYAELYEFDISIATHAIRLYEKLVRRRANNPAFWSQQNPIFEINKLDCLLCLNIALKYFEDAEYIGLDMLIRESRQNYDLIDVQRLEFNILQDLEFKMHHVNMVSICITLICLVKKKIERPRITFNDQFIEIFTENVRVFHVMYDYVQKIIKLKYAKTKNIIWQKYLYNPPTFGATIIVMNILNTLNNIQEPNNILPYNLYTEVKYWSGVDPLVIFHNILFFQKLKEGLPPTEAFLFVENLISI